MSKSPDPIPLDYASPLTPVRSSRLGGVSCWLGAAAIGVTFATAVMFRQADGYEQQIPIAVLGGGTACILALVGLGLGIAALVQNGRRHAPSVLGICLNAVVLGAIGLALTKA